MKKTDNTTIIPSVYEDYEFNRTLECCNAPLSWGIHRYDCPKHDVEKQDEDDHELLS